MKLKAPPHDEKRVCTKARFSVPSDSFNVIFDVLAQYTIDDLVKARPQINFLLGIPGLDASLPAA